MQVFQNYPLKELNSFGIPVYAAHYARISSVEDLIHCMTDSSPANDRMLILGGGSNILFTGNFGGLILHMHMRGWKVLDQTSDTVYLQVNAGEPWDDVVAYCVGQGWGGLENLSMIPGQTGSSPIQNIGAYGVELAEHFYCLDAFDKKSHKIHRFYKGDCHFGYRESIFKAGEKEKYIILSVTFALDTRPAIRTEYGTLAVEIEQHGILRPGIADVRNAVCRIRSRKLPDPSILGNAGSFFKNPVVPVQTYQELKKEHPDIVAFPDNQRMKIAAGWLIEKNGWKGYRHGDAGVHDKQALVLVNHGNATGKEILELSGMIRESVMQTFGISLQEEVHIV